MRIYIAGPMTGLPEFNYPAFYKAAGILESEGHEVFNPAARDTEKYGTDISNPEGCIDTAAKDHGFSRRETLAMDAAWICEFGEGIYMLTDWEKSRGAMAEHALAVALGLPVYYEAWAPPMPDERMSYYSGLLL